MRVDPGESFWRRQEGSARPRTGIGTGVCHGLWWGFGVGVGMGRVAGESARPWGGRARGGEASNYKFLAEISERDLATASPQSFYFRPLRRPQKKNKDLLGRFQLQ